MKWLSDVSLTPHHTFGLPAHAHAIVEAHTVEDLYAIWQHADDLALPKLVVGEGSNLLFCQDFQGVVVLNRLNGVSVDDESDHWILHVGAGESWHNLVAWSIDNGLPGLENLALIPGCVGAAPIQNIGAYGVEFCERCAYVDIVNPLTQQTRRLTRDACQFGYRDSIFKTDVMTGWVITQVGFRLAKAWQPVLKYGALADLDPEQVSAQTIFEAVCAIRQAKLPDPRECGNAGSFFKNPVLDAHQAQALQARYPEMPMYAAGEGKKKLAAGWLIDQCGLKGKQVGGARVHPKQALVLTNANQASSQDVIQLAKQVVDDVKSRFGVTLHHEVRFMGATGETSLEAQ
ncbi:UDP-N-acetylenolpyruvoylglucosamine reductase [Salinivibrio kushneri]|uniref:UDP-N-acetylenolpyruvoylglucosamine reductase n=1 Tax=Salinivibrio kushneri TaxID=1908198 RepID=A0AB36JU38_9GAMM|nr:MULTISPECIES: UDP-N-acetylmuramate dehydrogenase [Salinivibrio]ODP96731.1 UDP-N-acetylenolpyruvoylglucosamine reductase [Salinivibrio sp. BNH]OOE37768.1 UDP-N-acetylenolpyruvoylglucosamine reductase [Salinivibrio kushneri]OOE63781.1 UDP-N-acetylenolpyruvoylglucosamine reductase [Salinivibrio kushneri]QCP03106.1 UDP-N-acetylmuramate dehydrogenase [Salinivibrio kushneri]